ncbi:MAG: hypothetical protein ACK2UO_14155 [Caldilineaceae bacterium]
MTATRDSSGRFQVGNPGGPGRPQRRTEAFYMQAMMDEVPLDTWRDVVRAAVTAAKSGDHRARSWLAKYLVGEPKTEVPAPMQVIVEQLLQVDPALDRAAATLAKPVLCAMQYPTLADEDETQRRVEAEAAAAIRAAEPNDATNGPPTYFPVTDRVDTPPQVEAPKRAVSHRPASPARRPRIAGSA